MRKNLTVLILTLLTVLGVAAAEVYQPAKPGEVMSLEQARDKATPRHQPRELTSPFAAGFWVGTFGLAEVTDLDSFEQVLDDHEAGGGIEFGYSFNERLSVGLELSALARDIRDDFLSAGNVSVAYGIPFGRFKPFASANVGYERDLDINTGAGGGVEIGLTQSIRAALEVRYGISGNDEGVKQIRLSLRKTF